MAVNHLVAFSRNTTGAAIVAGAPYGCNILETSRRDVCGAMAPREPWSVLHGKLTRYLRRREADGLIDPLSALRGRRVYLFSGTQDWIVRRDVMKAVQWQLADLVGPDMVFCDFDVPATHGWVSDGTSCGPGQPGSNSSWCEPCDGDPSPVLACKGHDLAARALEFLQAGVDASKKTHANARSLFPLAQSDYLPAGENLSSAGLWHRAFVYAPKQCKGTGPIRGCAVHVHYHGCEWGVQQYGTGILKHLGILEWAEARGVVLVFPQAVGCWDWTGDTGPLFDTQEGVQIRTVMALLADLPRILTNTSGSPDVLLV